MRALRRRAVCSDVLRATSFYLLCPVLPSIIREWTVSRSRSMTSHSTFVFAFEPFELALESALWLLVSCEERGKGPRNRAGRVWAREGRRKTGMDAIEGDVAGRRVARQVRRRGPIRACSFVGLFLAYPGPETHERDCQTLGKGPGERRMRLPPKRGRESVPSSCVESRAPIRTPSSASSKFPTC
jgi:hypothetical protein